MAVVLILKSLMMFLSQQLLLVVLVSAEELKCPSSFDCGYLGQIKFPFTTTLQPHCGLLAIDGCQQNDSYASRTLQLNNPTPTSYSVLHVEPRTIIIRDDRQYHYLQTKNCTAFANNFSLPQTSSLASFYLKYNITIFRCNRSLNTTPPQHFYKYSNCSDYDVFYGPPNTQIPPGFKWPSSLTPCSTVQLAVEANSTNNPFQFLSASIAIEVRLSDTCESCLNRGEDQCLLDSRGNFYCTKESASIYFGVPVFTYKDLEKATKRFNRSRELGEGGFGIVYYAPQGTPGYVDPEYHRCYQLTNKSDVYSFGVVLIELISSMPAIDLSRHNDEINLADLAIKKIQKGEIAQLVDPSLSFDSNSDVKRQITSVAELAFQCLQRDRELRPSMDQVLEVLRRIESWKDESGHLKELNFHRSDPLSPDHVEMKLLRNTKMISSPKAVTDKWNSNSTSPNVRGQSPNKI
ncbi:hypothetical protein Fmac_023181 [Flemingia macrophylla]|uniref:Protein kinase domain-containing protein n=1 Tax=Flemingia macrophylla TaxID=520843 RepID=A0ABD1LLA8_9FABA